MNKCKELIVKIAGDTSRSLSEEVALSDWISLSSGEIPADCRRHLQKSWLQPIFQITKYTLMVKLEKTAFIAGVSFKGAADWLNAIPSSTTGLKLESRQFQIATALGLGVPVCSQRKCACGEQVMSDSNHALTCSKIKSRHSRHRQASDIIKHALVSADYPSCPEPNGLCVSTAKHPDGMTLLLYIRGKLLVWDFTCSH